MRRGTRSLGRSGGGSRGCAVSRPGVVDGQKRNGILPTDWAKCAGWRVRSNSPIRSATKRVSSSGAPKRGFASWQIHRGQRLRGLPVQRPLAVSGRHQQDGPCRGVTGIHELIVESNADTGATFVFLDKLSPVDLYLDGDPERTIDAAQSADLLEPSNMEHLDQALFLLGHGVESPSAASTVRGTSTSWNFRRRTRLTSRPSGQSK